ncbi:MAG: hypothetical protein NWP79_02620 [Paracoccaceae bacterium]|nr:hypothetical protein [Paracoccaceae bacterium]
MKAFKIPKRANVRLADLPNNHWENKENYEEKSRPLDPRLPFWNLTSDAEMQQTCSNCVRHCQHKNDPWRKDGVKTVPYRADKPNIKVIRSNHPHVRLA